MALTTTNFHPLGPIKSADLQQFYDLLTGVMVDQPTTLRNAISVGGNQGLTTVPLRVYGGVGQNTNLIDLYLDRTQAQPGFGLSAIGTLAWGPGGVAPQDTYLSRIARQHGHGSDTAGLLVLPRLEVQGTLGVDGATTLGGLTVSGASVLQGGATVTGALTASTMTASGAISGTTLRATAGPVYIGSATLSDAGSAHLTASGNLTLGGQLTLPGSASLTSTRYSMTGGASLLVGSTGDTVRALNHVAIDFDLTVGRDMHVVRNGQVDGQLIANGILRGSEVYAATGWHRNSAAGTGIYSDAVGVGIRFDTGVSAPVINGGAYANARLHSTAHVRTGYFNTGAVVNGGEALIQVNYATPFPAQATPVVVLTILRNVADHMQWRIGLEFGQTGPNSFNARVRNEIGNTEAVNIAYLAYWNE